MGIVCLITFDSLLHSVIYIYIDVIHIHIYSKYTLYVFMFCFFTICFVSVNKIIFHFNYALSSSL